MLQIQNIDRQLVRLVQVAWQQLMLSDFWLNINNNYVKN
jgi:hypothetical protein